jgi:hypothetical protein
MGESLCFLYDYFPQVFSSVLHPRHKLHYFKNAGWKETWIETSRDIVCAEFDQTYAFMDVDTEAQEAPRPLVCISNSSKYSMLTFLSGFIIFF